MTVEDGTVDIDPAADNLWVRQSERGLDVSLTIGLERAADDLDVLGQRAAPASFSATRNSTILFTSSAGSGLSTENRIVVCLTS